jgi:hypothetical protein
MIKSNQIFIPCYAKDADLTFTLTGNAGKLEVPVKEYNNVIILTEEEYSKLKREV